MNKKHWISVEYRTDSDKDFGFTRAYPLDGGPEEDVGGMVLAAIEDYEACKAEYPNFEWRLNHKYF